MGFRGVVEMHGDLLQLVLLAVVIYAAVSLRAY